MSLDRYRDQGNHPWFVMQSNQRLGTDRFESPSGIREYNRNFPWKKIVIGSHHGGVQVVVLYRKGDVRSAP